VHQPQHQAQLQQVLYFLLYKKYRFKIEGEGDFIYSKMQTAFESNHCLFIRSDYAIKSSKINILLKSSLLEHRWMFCCVSAKSSISFDVPVKGDFQIL
jgi:hypothetical protein